MHFGLECVDNGIARPCMLEPLYAKTPALHMLWMHTLVCTQSCMHKPLSANPCSHTLVHTLLFTLSCSHAVQGTVHATRMPQEGGCVIQHRLYTWRGILGGVYIGVYMEGHTWRGIHGGVYMEGSEPYVRMHLRSASTQHVYAAHLRSAFTQRICAACLRSAFAQRVYAARLRSAFAQHRLSFKQGLFHDTYGQIRGVDTALSNPITLHATYDCVLQDFTAKCSVHLLGTDQFCDVRNFDDCLLQSFDCQMFHEYARH